jgi:DNA replication and repair protein RecF
MKLERLTLENFRSYSKQVFNFGQHTVVVAANGSGKTNLLEAIYLLSSGKSERAGEISEMIKFGSEIGSVTGIVEDQDERIELSVVLTRGSYMGKPVPKRRYLVDGVARAQSKFVGRLSAVMFRPEDMRLVEGSPPRRRHLLDDTLSMVYPDYDRALSVYEASLKRRNKLLDGIREGVVKREQLNYWDQSIIKNGNILTDYRRTLLFYLSEVKTSFGEYQLEYEASTISPTRLEQYKEVEVAVGYTLVGPHKDDFIIRSQTSDVRFQGGRDLMKYGSRGEQRLAVLFLKLGTLKFIEEKLKIKPLLLLDDIFSELDEQHRAEVVAMTEGRQTIITTAEEEMIQIVSGADIIRL